MKNILACLGFEPKAAGDEEWPMVYVGHQLPFKKNISNFNKM